MKNTLTDLNNHLFEQLERLNDDELSDEELSKEIKRSEAMSKISEKIIANARVELDATKLMVENGYDRKGKLPVMLEMKDDKKNPIERKA